MLEPNVRLTLSLVQSIASVERMAGRWERLESSAESFGEETANSLATAGATAALLLDNSTSPVLAARLEALPSGGGEAPPELPPLIESLTLPFPDSADGLLRLQQAMRMVKVSEDYPYRAISTFFTAPGRLAIGEEPLFPAIQPFLVRNRTAELLAWANEELDGGQLPHLLTIGLFHIIFLQILPFASHNHALSLLLQAQLLRDNGYSFVRFSPLSVYYAKHSGQYFAALRQAEKSIGSTWATVNGWLEFFLHAVEHSAESAIETLERAPDKQRLTRVQKQIVEVVRIKGPATRELIADQTGINLSTVKYNLGVLSTRRVLNRLGGGRTTAYTVF